MISDKILDACNSELASKVSALNLQNFCEWIAPQAVEVGVSYYDLGYFLRIFGSDWHPEWIISSMNQLAHDTMFWIENQLWRCQNAEMDLWTQEYSKQLRSSWTDQQFVSKNLEHESITHAAEGKISDDIFDPRYFQTPKMFDDSCPVFNDYFKCKFLAHEGKLVGFYTQSERKNKINHLRSKLMKRKLECPINKLYKGRSKAARTKPRFWGKFVKSDLAEKYAVDDNEVHKRNALIDKYVSMMDYQKTVDVLAEY